ncbi:MAG: hypothetical protein CVU56_29970 [Deltaproteobacteria bacterium HGW-Deltaproteobacteria-14]|jgi:microsomal dipeptidase-like Zn-dependent dipeptidase|nr:MAG: hypothetical protein CVU56_29970 [Deltaproteobacteria bacterium HGW-Deltaproteobacteria-14]
MTFSYSAATSAATLTCVFALLGGVSGAAPPPPNGCYTLKARSTGKFLSHGSVAAYTADRSEAGDWEKFCVIHTLRSLVSGAAADTVMIQDERLAFMSSQGATAVLGAWQPAAFEEWVPSAVSGGGWAFESKAHGGYLSADATLGGIVSTKPARKEWEVWDLLPATGCKCSPSSDADIATDATPQPGTGPVFGIADTHQHMFAHLGFGGYELHGQSSSVYGIHGALPRCDFVHGPNSSDDPLGRIVSGELHVGAGDPSYSSWPSYHNANHQQLYYKWLERAWRGGLRLQVMLAVDNEFICQFSKVMTVAAYASAGLALVNGVLPPPPPDLGVSCDDMQSVDRQVAAAKALESFIDAQSGGSGKGWYRVAYTPAEARHIIERGKLAVVLGAEVDTLFGCSVNSRCTPAQVDERLAALVNKGVRHIFPVHVLNNGFGGAAQYAEAFLGANVLKTGAPFDLVECDNPKLTKKVIWAPMDGPLCVVLSKWPGLAELGRQICKATPPDWRDVKDAKSHCNRRGLTELGGHLINRMMDNHLVIDVDHMSARTLEATLAIAEARRYPVVAGHTGLVDTEADPSEGQHAARDIDRIRALGGLIAPILHAGLEAHEIKPFGSRIAHDCGGSTRAWAQNYLLAVAAMGGPDTAAVPIGSDMNGWVTQIAPRFGPRACGGEDHQGAGRSPRVAYPFDAHGVPGRFGQLVTGWRTFDFNDDGMANIGLLPDLVQDLKNIGLTDRELAPMFRSAEGYLAMWEKAQGDHDAYARVPLGGAAASMNWADAARHCASQGKRLANRGEVCPKGDGAPLFGRPGGDVWMAVADHPNAWISIGTSYTERGCKLHEEAHGGMPAWGLDKGPEPVTHQAAALRCVDYTRIPLGSAADGLAKPGLSKLGWSDADAYCTRQGLRLATRADVCPAGADGEPRYGRVPGDVWMAVGDRPNAWLSVGTLYADARQCRLHEETYGAAPAWGLDKGPELAVAARVPGAVVCLPPN